MIGYQDLRHSAGGDVSGRNQLDKISRIEVTQGQFFEVLEKRPVEPEIYVLGDSCKTAGVGDDLPVACVDGEILGERNAPLLDPIAWYRGNSGVDFDLERGVDSSDWKEKQHVHELAGTRSPPSPMIWRVFPMPTEKEGHVVVMTWSPIGFPETAESCSPQIAEDCAPELADYLGKKLKLALSLKGHPLVKESENPE